MNLVDWRDADRLYIYRHEHATTLSLSLIFCMCLVLWGGCRKDDGLGGVVGPELEVERTDTVLDAPTHTVRASAEFAREHIDPTGEIERGVVGMGALVDWSLNLQVEYKGLVARSGPAGNVGLMAVPFFYEERTLLGIAYKFPNDSTATLVSLQRLAKLVERDSVDCMGTNNLAFALAYELTLLYSEREPLHFLQEWMEAYVTLDCASALRPRHCTSTRSEIRFWYPDDIYRGVFLIHVEAISCTDSGGGGGGDGSSSGSGLTDDGGGNSGTSNGNNGDPGSDPKIKVVEDDKLPEFLMSYVENNCPGWRNSSKPRHSDGRLLYAAGKAFELGVLNALIFKNSNSTPYPSAYRAYKSRHGYVDVIPDAVSGTPRIEWPSGRISGYYPETSFTEIKGCIGSLSSSYRDYQLSGMIDVLNMNAKEFGMPSSMQPTLTIYGPQGGSAGRSLISYANSQNVRIHYVQIQVYDDGTLRRVDLDGTTDMWNDGYAKLQCPNQVSELPKDCDCETVYASCP